MPVEVEAVGQAVARRADGVDQKWADEGAEQRAVSQRRDAKPARADHPTHDDEQVVEDGAERRVQKHPPREQHRGNNSASVEEDLAGQQNAREMNAQLQLVGRKVREDKPLQLRREDLQQHRAQAHHRGHDGDGGVEGVLRLPVASLGGVARIDRNESDGGGAARENVVEEVR